MRRNLVIIVAIIGVIAGMLYAAHAMDLVGMIARAHGG